MQEKLFVDIGRIISSSAIYKGKLVTIDRKKLSQHFKTLEKTKLNKIIFAAQKIAEEQSARINKDSSSLRYNLEGINKLLLSVKIDYNESKFLIKNELLDTLNKALIEDSGLIEKIKSSVEAVYSTLENGTIDQEIPSAFRELNNCLENLKYYKNHIKLPSWVDEIFVRQENNKAVVEKNIECVKALQGKISVISFEPQDNVIDNFDLCFSSAIDIQDAMNQNNDLLSRIEKDMNAKKDAALRVIKSFEKFQSIASDLVILKYLESDDEPINYKLESFVNSLKPPKELLSVSLIDNQLMVLKDCPIINEMKTIHILETTLGLKSSLSLRLNEFSKNISEIKQQLNSHKEKLLFNEKSPIPESIFIFERSSWQSCKTLFANISKFFIGHVNHCNLYGHTDGVEELRRAVNEIEDNEISMLELQF